MTQTDAWTAWHLHLDSPAHTASDRVLTHVVAPLARATGHPWFFIRYWQGGPHIRLRVRDLSAAQADDLAQRLGHGLAQWGPRRNGELPVNDDAYADDAGRHARGETGDGRAVDELMPLGVYARSYEPELERYGGDQLMPASEEIFVHSSGLVSSLLPLLPTMQRRRGVALRLARASAESLGGSLERAVFYEIGRRSWAAWATSYGYSEAVVAAHAELPGRACNDSPAPVWLNAWGSCVADLVTTLREAGHPVPGAVVASQVHMSHNRLGVGILDELSTYARLAAAHPAPVEAVPDLGLLVP